MKKILLVRSDRIGDVVLTTPMIKMVRDHFPQSHIAFLTGPQTQGIVQGNPFLDEVIIYDKYKSHQSVLKTILFARKLKKKRFDLAIIFNPSKRTHWITFLAGIPQRIGYNRKGGWLLTHALEDKKGEGLKPESFYNEDLLSLLALAPRQSQDLHFPISQETENKIDRLLKTHQIDSKFVVINVSAGCPSKKWPLQNFAKLSQLLYQKLNLKIILIGQQKECETVQMLAQIPPDDMVILAETLPLQQLGALLKNAYLHISNDTGPQHIAAALGTPILTIFGRNLPGLSPKRWAPLGQNHTHFHKNIGCNPCLAHQCQLDFDCLKTIKAEEVFHAVKNYT
ncbi:MAG: glycosyltransferase family 9 protein [Deltaproteobacteria bacterium]|nr:glycosyltransferase family 9 protein [Deltaproteobacteria bacterium]